MSISIDLHNIQSYTNQEVQIQGWVHGIRGSNKVQFLQLRNCGHIIQVVASLEELGEELFHTIKSLTQETSVIVTGKVVESPKAPTGYEIILSNLSIIHVSKDYPITPKEHGPDFLHNHRHLWLRSKKQLAIIQVRDELSFQIRKFFHDKKFVLIDTPILTGSIGESAGTLFETEYFDLGKAYLAQTGQLYLETAIFAHNKVYCFGPTFRAEKSKTRRHLTEFWMLEAETANFHNEDNIQFQEEFVKSIVIATVENCKSQLQVLERDISILQSYIDKPFIKIEYSDVIALLQSKGEDIQWGEDINSEREKMITDHYQSFVFIKNYPRSIKAFYMKQNPDRLDTVLCADLIAPEGVGEIIGGSEREENYDKIVERLNEEKLPVESYSWYLDLRKYGSVPHSGFGLGSERLIAWVCGLPHVRECIPYPRLMGRLDP